MKIQVLIVDDEPLARERIRDLLKHEPNIEIAGESKNGLEAVSAIQKQKLDLVFLDVQMPELDGFGVIETIGVEKMPYIIFVTAYDQYALRAFEVHALDYLLKPFDHERFQNTLKRAIEHVEIIKRDNDFTGRLKELIHEVQLEQHYLQRIIIKSRGRIFLLNTDEIDWIEAAGNYVVLHVGSEEHLLRATMYGIEERLDPERFIRIHRSKIVNIERIKEIQNWFQSEYLIILKDGTQLTLSRTYREKFEKLFKNF